MPTQADQTNQPTRAVRDTLGEMHVPQDAYYGAQTARAMRNFPVSGQPARWELFEAMLMIKRAAAQTHGQLGLLDAHVAGAVAAACDDLIAGAHRDQFVVDVYQAGAGTSLNMNVNEVTASLALEKLGQTRDRGDLVHPNDHVNMAQSTNDTIPTATQIAVRIRQRKLNDVLAALADAFAALADRSEGIWTAGRTHLQDAATVRIADRFRGMAVAVSRCRAELEQICWLLHALPLGGSAVGTGLNCHPDYARLTVQQLAETTGLPFVVADHLPSAMQSQLPAAAYSGRLRDLTVELARIANDLRLMSSGPTSGIGEIRLPPVQPGSSIMPGKINPVMCECLNMICFRVQGNDLAVAQAAAAGQFELNVMMPIIAHCTLESQAVLTNYLPVFKSKCIDGIEVDETACRRYAERTVGLGAALNPVIGYERAAQVVKHAVANNLTIRQAAAAFDDIDPAQVESALAQWLPPTKQ
ncbi:MAG: aspartate ammonia-lyase [Phycisphaerae bacterium]|nr:aspartate ammonia-lyase [Phycisphaerae bacterium]